MSFKRHVLASIVIFMAGASVAFAQVIDRPAATVNLTQPQYISVSQLDQRVNQVEAIRRQAGLPIPADAKMQVLDSMIAEILIDQAATKAKISVTQTEINDVLAQQQRSAEVQLGPITEQQFQTVVEQQTGLTWSEYLKQINKQLLEQKYITQEKQSVLNDIPTPTEQQIQEQYSQIATQLTNPEIIRFSQIYLDTRNLNAADKEKAQKLANKIYQEYENGQATFNQLVQEYTNDQAARYNGGDFGYLARNDARAVQLFGQHFMNELFALPVGQVSPPLQSNIGYHIVKVTEHYPPKLLTLSDPISPANKTTVREYISNMITQQEKAQAFQKAVNEIVAKLKKEADITIYKQNIN